MSELTRQLEVRLPELARGVISGYLDDSPARDYFLQNLDDPSQHEQRWHQFGIITHNKRAVEAYENEAPSYLHEWGLEDRINSYLDQRIDGMRRADVLSVGFLFHDIGKFAARAAVIKDGLPSFTFKGHERFSGEIVESEPFDFLEIDFDISPHNRKNIALYGKHHYDLGVLRERANESPLGYTMAFAASEDFRGAVQAVRQKSALGPIIGVLFLADNLSKTDIRLPNVETDDDIAAQSSNIPAILSARGLDSRLIQAVQQLPVNIEVARRYLEA